MSAIKLDQLDAQLARALAPVYVVHGDEPLLSLEAADAIRAKARAAGYTQRDVHTVERGFDWSRLSASASAMSLFGDRTLIELRLPTGKPGTEGAAAIVAHCQTVSDDVLTLVSVPRLDRAGQNSAWFGALDRAGVVVNVFGVDRAHLPQWIAQRLARRLCDRCREAYQPDPEHLAALHFAVEPGRPLPTLYRPVGCPTCSKTGFRGRIAVHEVMRVTEEIERLTVARASSAEIGRTAREQGMLTLREDGWSKIQLGLTSIDEILRVVA